MNKARILTAVTAFILFISPSAPQYAADMAITGKSIGEAPVYNKKGTISMDFENADLKSVLKAFSMQTGVNFVTSDIVENKKITVFLSNVSTESALTSILEANDLLYEKQMGGVYLIKPTGKEVVKTVTRVFKLNYLQVYKMSLPEGAAGSTSGVTIIGERTVAAPSAGGDDSSQPKNIGDVLKSLMSKHGRIIADRRNNSLIITDIPDVFEAIEETIKKLDIEPIQVMIQTEIIETTTSGLKRIGIEYGSETQLAQITYTGGSSSSGGTTTTSSPTFPTPFPFTENFIKDTFNTNLAASGLFNYGTIKVGDIDVILKLFSLDSDTKYLSRPKIMTINNEPAVIKVSANTAIGTTSTTVTTAGANIATAERTETGVILKVTPQVNDKGDIFMFIEPSISRAVQSTLSAAYLDPSYRSSVSTVMVRDGETVVVAGLIQTNNFKTTRKVPFLGDIPFLGEPFKSRYNKTEDTELIIFITPRIVKRQDAEYVTPKNMMDRERMLEKTLDDYNSKSSKTDKAAIKREELMTKTLRKYSSTSKTSRK